MQLSKWTLFAAAILAFCPVRTPAQTGNGFLTLHAFSALSSGTNTDGANPFGGLVVSGGTAYGTTSDGGANGYGTVFKVNLDGSGFTNIYNFTGGSDGAAPEGPLALSGNTLYGTASSGGSGGYGVVFSFNTESSRLIPIYAFTNGIDGTQPAAGVIVSGAVIYGTTEGNAAWTNFGSVFQVNTNGKDFIVLHHFESLAGDDGAYPYGPIVLSGKGLYGTTFGGGDSGTGTLFKVQTDSTNFMTVFDFLGINSTFTNATGAYPEGGVMLSGGTLYGTTRYGGAAGNGGLGWGTVFAVSTSEAGLAPIYSFNGLNDFGNPWVGLTSSSNMLYGTTPYSIFALNTGGTGFTNLYSSASPVYPNGGLVVMARGASVYGTTYYGGFGNGAVFALSLSSLTAQLAGGKVTLSWSNPALSLQAAPTVGGIYTNIAAATSPYVTGATGSQMFFRLVGN